MFCDIFNFLNVLGFALWHMFIKCSMQKTTGGTKGSILSVRLSLLIPLATLSSSYLFLVDLSVCESGFMNSPLVKYFHQVLLTFLTLSTLWI